MYISICMYSVELGHGLYAWPLTLCFPISRPVDEERLRPVTQLDLLFGLDKMKESKQATAYMSTSVPEVPLDWTLTGSAVFSFLFTHQAETHDERRRWKSQQTATLFLNLIEFIWACSLSAQTHLHVYRCKILEIYRDWLLTRSVGKLSVLRPRALWLFVWRCTKQLWIFPVWTTYLTATRFHLPPNNWHAHDGDFGDSALLISWTTFLCRLTYGSTFSPLHWLNHICVVGHCRGNDLAHPGALRAHAWNFLK